MRVRVGLEMGSKGAPLPGRWTIRDVFLMVRMALMR